MSKLPLAFFITFSTYGTWLPGSSKGKGSVDRQHNRYGDAFVESDPYVEQLAREHMTQPPFVMKQPAVRAVVCQAIVEIASEKQWTLLAVHVRTNHVHQVIAADRAPDRLMSELKARASRNLNRAGYDDATRHRWTRHGSNPHLFRDEEVVQKIHYTVNEQGPRMAWFCHPDYRHLIDAGVSNKDPLIDFTTIQDPRTK